MFSAFKYLIDLNQNYLFGIYLNLGIIISMNKEDYFINCIKNGKSRFIGDDAAILNNMSISQDAFFENVHFKREWMSLYEIAKKAMLVNISDAIAMNGKPKYALLTVAIPKNFTYQELKELAQGFLDIAKAYGVAIIGGDTISNTKLDISITILAQCHRPIHRAGIKVGDLLGFTGSLGESRKELMRLLKGCSIKPNSKFLEPKLKDSFFYKVAPFIRSAMDISDGLFADLEKLHRINRVGFKFFKPISKMIGCSAEEYEILFAFDPRYEKKIKNIAKLTKTKLTIFARAVRKSYKNLCKANHF